MLASDTQRKLRNKETSDQGREEGRRETTQVGATSPESSTRCIICMGLPGSGKSTFANALPKSFPPENSWLVINQDRLGRKECEMLAGGCKRGRRTIRDRCNPTESDRVEWLDNMHSPARGEVALVYFAADANICISRVEERTNHETIPQGWGRKIVNEMAKSIHVVHTFDDARELVPSLGARV